MRWALWLGLLAGCGSDEPALRLIEDQGRFCIDETDGSYVVQVQLCLAEACDTVTEIGCDGALQGDTLVVSSWVRIERDGLVCNELCRPERIPCDLPLITDTDNLMVEHGTSLDPFRNTPGCSDAG